MEDFLDLKLAGEEHHAQVLTFHAELAFLIRTFFFVLLGVVVEYKALTSYLPQVLGLIGAVILARVLAVRASSWAWKGLQPGEREVVLWIMPRGLIAVVLALQVVHARGNNFAFLPAVAFATILVTNFMLVIGSIRASRLPMAASEIKQENEGKPSEAIAH